MKEHPILMSRPMVQATLAGVKRVTRRVIMARNSTVGPGWPWSDLDFSGDLQVDGCATGPCFFGCGQYLHVPHREGRTPGAWMEGTSARVRCLWEPGDLLWVRETTYRFTGCGRPPADALLPPDGNPYNARRYAADWRPGAMQEESAWETSPSILMPRWASRLTLRVTGVRAERLGCITEEDARAEGVGLPECDYLGRCNSTRCRRHCADPYRQEFIRLWDSINAARGFGWERDPFVWAVTFEVTK